MERIMGEGIQVKLGTREMIGGLLGSREMIG